MKEIEMTETYTFQSPIGYFPIATEKDSVSKVHLEAEKWRDKCQPEDLTLTAFGSFI